MVDESRGVVLFESIHSLFQLKAALEGQGLVVKAVPTPRHLSSDCGSSLLFPAARLRTVRRIVAEQGLDVQGIHELE